MEIKKKTFKLIPLSISFLSVITLSAVFALPQKVNALVDFVPSDADSMMANQINVGVEMGSLLKSAPAAGSFYPTLKSFKVSAVSQAVDYGRTATLSWDAGAQPGLSCTLSQYAYGGTVLPYRKFVSVSSSGYTTDPLTEDRRFYIYCNADGYRSVGSIWIKVNAPKVVDPKIVIYPEIIPNGKAAFISWNGGNASKCSLTKAGVAYDSKVSGFQQSTGALTKNTEFKLTCSGTSGTKTAYAVAKVDSATRPSVLLSVNPLTVVYGSTTAVTWSSKNATNCTVGLGNIASWKTGLSGDKIATPPIKTNTEVKITCSGPAGTVSDSVIVGVNAWLPTPYTGLALKATPSIIQAGESTTLSWDAGDSTAKCRLGTSYYNRSDPAKDVGNMYSETNGYKVGPLNEWAYYSVTCEGQNSKKNGQTWVKVGTASAPITTLVADLKASKTNIIAGQSVNLTWTTKGAKTCTLSNGVNSNWKTSLSGTNVSTGPIKTTTDFILNCGDGVDTIRKVVTVTVASLDTNLDEKIEPCVNEKPAPGSNKIDTAQTALCKDVVDESSVTPPVKPNAPYTPTSKFFDYQDRLGQILEVDKVEVKKGETVAVNWVANPEHLASCSLNKYVGTVKTSISGHHTGSSNQVINSDTEFIFDCRRYGTHNHYYAKMKVKVLPEGGVATEPSSGKGLYFNMTQNKTDDSMNTIFLIADKLVVEKGGKVKVAWSEGTLNTTYTPYCHIYKIVGTKSEEISSSNNGITDVVINANTDIKVDCRPSYSHNHVTQTLHFKLDVKNLVSIDAFGAVPTYITEPKPITISWKTRDAVSCVLTRDNKPMMTIPQAQLASGSTTTEPLMKTTDFRITCTGRIAGDTRTSNSIVTVVLKSTAMELTASPMTVAKGGSSKISWSSTNNAVCYVDKAKQVNWKQGPASKDVDSGALTEDTEFVLRCTTPGGIYTKKVKVIVTPALNAPTVKISTSASEVNKGNIVAVSWSSTNADSCSVYRDTTLWKTGTSMTNVNSTPINQATVFWVTCKGKAGTVSANTVVQVK